MIEVIGDHGSAEFEAANQVRDALIKLWPGIETTSEEEELIRIASGVKLSGYAVSDFDIVICAAFKPGRKFMPKRPLTDQFEQRVIGKPVDVPNLVVAIEVKDNAPFNVRFTADKVEVRYSRGDGEWASATEQNIKQVHALRSYFGHIANTDIWIHRLVLLRSIEQVNCVGALGRGFTGADLLTAFGGTSGIKKRNQDFILSSGSDEAIGRTLSAPIFRRLAATTLDRKRMDRIAVRSATAQEWREDLGNKMLKLRGRGGSGKTILLLQTAWLAFQETGARSVILTYNHALAADIRRSMALLGIPSAADSGGIAVQTVMSFMLSWFNKMQLIDHEAENGLADYGKHCRMALEMFRAGAILPGDLADIRMTDPERFDFDYVFVDEAQDWPADELEALKYLYGPERLCLADGVDQLVRGKVANWEQNVPESHRKVVPLKRCLRMKANLAVFANAVADAAGLNWRVEPNDMAGGGRIILVAGSYASQSSLHGELLQLARKAGNAEIDFLFAVPPSDVKGSDGSRSSKLAGAFTGSGMTVWDATNESERRDFPRGIETYRVVQYSSCRGLEGWCVVCEGLDDFWEFRRGQGLRDNDTAEAAERYLSISDLAAEDAWKWCMIPLTRPIDTLVICLSDLASPFSQTLIRLAKMKPDIIERIGF